MLDNYSPVCSHVTILRPSVQWRGQKRKAISAKKKKKRHLKWGIDSLHDSLSLKWYETDFCDCIKQDGCLRNWLLLFEDFMSDCQTLRQLLESILKISSFAHPSLCREREFRISQWELNQLHWPRLLEKQQVCVNQCFSPIICVIGFCG